ncbi:uncharacterized protein LOC116162051 [Photinus pyralis]|uniref:uncharacterized protein LOC116162051 n=1 Tax=Photinus pyralis TaxID=7054 RepID=UPI0012677231|nr:uncharacterized protein LOC116162051 [Photinus pyralis]XP_031331434.1 uncharacterized protein LOC116162051 [Photinus pyralis]
MKGDEISFVAKTDSLIVRFGDSYLKKHKRERISYVCSNRMRELARLLIAYRDIVGRTNVDFKQLLLPKNFDSVLSAVRIIVGYDPIKNTFKTPSLAMHLGTSLKLACQELSHLVLKETRGFRAQSPDLKTIWLKDIKNFKMLVESRWNIELASLANKDLMEKRWQKPLLLPLVSDIKIFRDECLKMAEECENVFRQGNDDRNTYKLLLNCTLALLIVFNRRRIGDIQYLKIADYKRDIRSDVNDFESVLTDVEKMLTSKYKRVVNGGKGNRAVVILIPELLQRFIDIILKNRDKYITSDNEYVFAVPGSTVPWGKGDVAIRALTKNMKLKNPTAISSNKLRKQIATVMQLLNLSKDESKQFAQFMGHTEKTHQEFYELPVDIYQTAKVSKILLASEKGIPAQYKGRSLADINFDENLEYAVENNDADEGVILLPENEHFEMNIEDPQTKLLPNTYSSPTACIAIDDNSTHSLDGNDNPVSHDKTSVSGSQTRTRVSEKKGSAMKVTEVIATIVMEMTTVTINKGKKLL